jgi:hypothetical protein
MPFRLFPVIAMVCLTAALYAQSEKPAHYQLYGGYTFLSNSINGVPGSRQPMNGWDASIAFPSWHDLRFKIDVYGYDATNLGASQKPWYIMAGGQYTRRLGRESVFVEGLFGDAGINRYWGPNQLPGDTASFVTLLGGGLDTPISRRLAFRASAGYQWSNFSLVNNVSQAVPYTYPGIPRYFARISSGLVWSF